MTDFLFSEFYLEDLAGEEPPAIHPRFTEMIHYLAAVAPAGRLPGRQHIDPCDFPSMLGLINLVDVERRNTAMQFRFRLVGEEQTRAAGRNITGLVVEDAVVPALVERIKGNMRKVVSTRLPIYDRFPMPHPDRQFIDSQRMYYPLAADGKTINMLLILNAYDRISLRAVG
ncbi:MAG: PAS domain-containing protein [Kiloniellaceae bacterium]